MEEWRPAYMGDGFYEVSNKGRVRSVRSNLVLKQANVNGYKKVTFSFGKGGNKTVLVHRLVAMAFIENPNEYQYVNHKDENKTNNIVSNLEWCTAKYNVNYGIGALARNHSIIQRTPNGEFVKKWESLKEAADYYKTNYQNISQVCRGRRKTAVGYKWEYAGKIQRRKRHGKD